MGGRRGGRARSSAVRCCCCCPRLGRPPLDEPVWRLGWASPWAPSLEWRAMACSHEAVVWEGSGWESSRRVLAPGVVHMSAGGTDCCWPTLAAAPAAAVVAAGGLAAGLEQPGRPLTRTSGCSLLLLCLAWKPWRALLVPTASDDCVCIAKAPNPSEAMATSMGTSERIVKMLANKQKKHGAHMAGRATGTRQLQPGKVQAYRT